MLLSSPEKKEARLLSIVWMAKSQAYLCHEIKVFFYHENSKNYKSRTVHCFKTVFQSKLPTFLFFNFYHFYLY